MQWTNSYILEILEALKRDPPKKASLDNSASNIDNMDRIGYTEATKGATGRRLAPTLDYEVTVWLGPGGYFFFVACMNRATMLIITSVYWNSSANVTMLSPPPV